LIDDIGYDSGSTPQTRKYLFLSLNVLAKLGLDENEPEDTLAPSTNHLEPAQEPIMRLVYHPHSHYPEEQLPLQVYQERTNSPTEQTECTTVEQEWWRPFQSEADFDFSDFVTEHRLPKLVIDDLLQRLEVWCNTLRISFKTHRDVDKFTEAAAASTTKVSGKFKSEEVIY
jgi:hypothetical protein